VFASLLAKRRLYSGATGQARLEEQLKSAQGMELILNEVEAAWGGKRVPGGLLEALRWSICRDPGLRASWGTLLAKLARDEASPSTSPSSSSSSSSPPITFTAAGAAAEYVRGLSEGERELIEVEETIEGMVPDGGAELGRLWLRKGNIHMAMEQHVQAERAYQAALTTLRAHLPPRHPDIATSLNNLAGLYEFKGGYDRALPLYKQALKMRREALPPGHPDIATSLNDLAFLYSSKGEYERALPLYAQALEMRREALPPSHPDIATSLNNLAFLYRSKGEYDRALPLYAQALEMRREVLPPGHADIATSFNNLAACTRSRASTIGRCRFTRRRWR
jgi:tetratricopeptide (TPR) repeat protein